jgi:hypothetical protein
VLGGRRDFLGTRREPFRRRLVGRAVDEVARAVRPRRDARGAFGGLGDASVGRADDELPEPEPPSVALPASRFVRAEERPVDDRLRLLGRRQRQRFVYDPRERLRELVRRLRNGRRRRPQRVGVQRLRLAQARGRDPVRADLAVQVDERRGADLPGDLAFLDEPAEQPPELPVNLRR